ncbi:hypothetical protein [Luteimonas saliphila]|uniref:hypothetical protein n=1 Tax=Luteimonas saliphila TaxID=2804919 RepID=UPI00192D47E7|nr:hypothetical protein [Luteimonas saliphila]
MKYSAEERDLLVRRARDAGLPLNDYIREQVLAEAGCEEQVLRHLVEELTRVAEDNRRAVAEGGAEAEEGTSERPSTQRDRIAKEVRESLAQQEIAALAEFFKPAFDAGRWPGVKAES